MLAQENLPQCKAYCKLFLSTSLPATSVNPLILSLRVPEKETNGHQRTVTFLSFAVFGTEDALVNMKLLSNLKALL